MCLFTVILVYTLVFLVYIISFVVFLCFFIMLYLCILFFFKQKTAYEMRISDWSSDVCSSDLVPPDIEFRACMKALIAVFWRITSAKLLLVPVKAAQIGRASCRERVCQYV